MLDVKVKTYLAGFSIEQGVRESQTEGRCKKRDADFGDIAMLLFALYTF